MKKSQSLASFFKQVSTRRGEKRDFKGGKKAPKSRLLRLEALENRELLSVSPTGSNEAAELVAAAYETPIIELPDLDETPQGDPGAISIANLDFSPESFDYETAVSVLQENNVYVTSFYATIFIGATDGDRSYNGAKNIYRILTDDMRVASDNVFLFFGDASAREGYDWSFAKNVVDANYENLSLTLAYVNQQMNPNSTLMFISNDNGARDQTLYCDRGETITGPQLRDALYQIQSGSVLCSFPKRDQGDAVEAVFNPATGANYSEYDNALGERVAYQGEATFAYEAIHSLSVTVEDEEGVEVESNLVVSCANDVAFTVAAEDRLLEDVVGDYTLDREGGWLSDRWKCAKNSFEEHVLEPIKDYVLRPAAKALTEVISVISPGLASAIDPIFHGDYSDACRAFWEHKFQILGEVVGTVVDVFSAETTGGMGHAVGSVLGRILDGEGVDGYKVAEIAISQYCKPTDEKVAENVFATAYALTTIHPLPPASASISVAAREAKSVKLNLENVGVPHQATELLYRVQGGGWNTISLAGKTFVNGSKTAVDIARYVNLTPGAVYDVCSKIRLASSSGTGIEIWSPNVSFRAPTAVATPTITQVVKESPTQLSVRWNQVANANGYEIVARNTATGKTITQNVSASASSYVFKGLQDGTKYQIQVRAKGGKNVVVGWRHEEYSGWFGKKRQIWVADRDVLVDSNWAQTYVTTPITLRMAPLTPTGDTNDLLSAVQWSDPLNGGDVKKHVDHYEVRYRPVGGSNASWKPVTLTENNSTTGLASGHYEVQYRAVMKDDKYMAADGEGWTTSYYTRVSLRHLVGTNSDSASAGSSLRQAINQLNAGGDGDLIILTEALRGQTITLGSTLTINKSVTIDASRCLNPDGTPGVTIDAGGKQAFNFSSGATNVVLNGLRIINGGVATTQFIGGAVYSEAKNLTITNCKFENNVAGSGGAVFIQGTEGQALNVTIKNSVFSNNNSVHTGGAVFIRGANATGKTMITDSRFLGNSACVGQTYTDGGVHGAGAIYAREFPNLTIERSEFQSNVSGWNAGAILLNNVASTTITDSVFDGSSSGTGCSGGAIYASGGALNVNSSSFIGNQSGLSGGAIYTNSTTTVIDAFGVEKYSLFSGNTASSLGGAICALNSSFSTDGATFSNNSAAAGGAIHLNRITGNIWSGLFYGNRASQYGGALQLSSTYATDDTTTKLNIGAATFVDNTAPVGSSVEIYTQTSGKKATLYAKNSIFISESGDEIQLNGTNAVISADWIIASDLSEWGTTTQSVTYDPTRPLFTDRENNDYTLAEGSQAINRGYDLYVASPSNADVCRDLNYAPRQVGGRMDIGAYEYQTLTPRTWTVTVPADSATNQGSLRYILDHAHEGDTIVFDESLRGGTISLNSELAIKEGITIDATALWDAENDAPGVTIAPALGKRIRLVNIEKYAGSVTIKGLTLANGEAKEENSQATHGGSIYKNENANLTLEKCYIVGNTSSGYGGAVYAIRGSLNVVDSVFEGNTTRNGHGAGVYSTGANVSITSSRFEGNDAASYHGGALFVDGANLEVNDSVFRSNTASASSALKVVSGNMTVRNSLVTNNTGAGTIHLLRSGVLSIYNSTIVNNDSKQGPTVSIGTGATSQSSVLNLYNSIVAFNTATNGKQVGQWAESDGTKTFNYYNTLSTQNLGSANGNIYYAGSAAALFADPTNGDYRLNPDSVAVNAGSNAYVSGDYDLAGAPRIQANRVDLGAFETTGRTIVVTSSSDDATDEGSLRYAIDHARHGDYITFAGALRGATINLSQQLAITKTITIDGTGSDLTFDGGGATRAFYVNAPGHEVVLKGLTFTNGLAGSQASGVENSDAGGAIENYRGSVSLVNCAFEGNVGYFGGAVLNHDVMTVDGCEFSNNASYYGGGAIFNGAKYGAGQTSAASLTVTNTRFVENIADKYVDESTQTDVQSNIGWRFGGAILNYKGTLTITSSVFLSNETHGDDAGALYNELGTVTIRESLFDGNYSPNVGGAIENHGGSMWIFDSELTNNVAFNGISSTGSNLALGSGGGAVFNNGGTLNITGGVFTKNYSPNYYGGAIYSVDATLNVTNSVFSENAAGLLENGEFVPGTDGKYGGGSGGAIYVHSKTANNYSHATITNTLISRNVAANGGGIVVQNAAVDLNNVDLVYNLSKSNAGGLVVDASNVTTPTASVVNARNSIIVENALINATGKTDVKKGTSATLNSYNTIAGWSTRAQWSVGGTDFYYNESRPLFADPANDDFTLTADSQAVDRGISYSGVSETDVVGAPRVANSRIDLGAFELQTPRTPQQIVVSNASDSNVAGSLPRALSLAQPGDTIVFTSAVKGQTIEISTELKIAQSVTIDASDILNADGTPGVTISGRNTTRIFKIDPVAKNVTIKGVAFINGAPNTSSNGGYGGAIHAMNVNLTITDCVFDGNESFNHGGAIYAVYQSGAANCDFIVESSTFSNNKVKLFNGGACSGGAIYIEGNGRTILTVRDSHFESNQTEEDANNNLGHAGAIQTYLTDVEIDRSYFEKNHARYGGAMFLRSGNVTINNSIVAENTATRNGSAIEIFDNTTAIPASLKIFNTTVVGNVSANNEGAIFLHAENSSTVRFEAYNSIIAYSSKNGQANVNGNADVGVYAQANSSIVKVARNVLTNYTGWTDSLGVFSSANYAFDSVLRSNEDAYTHAPKYSLRDGSIARDPSCPTGEQTYYNTFVRSDVDLRGNVRVYGDYVDMGAYEYYDFDNEENAKPTLPTIAITGEARVGSTLSVEFESGTAPTARYQWYFRNDENAWEAIPGATEPEYTPTEEVAGRRLRVLARPTGYFSGSARSAQTSGSVVMQLDAPNFTVTEVDPNAITLEWFAEPLAGDYRVQYRASDSDAWTTLNYSVAATTTTSGMRRVTASNDPTLQLKATGLAPNTSYEFRIAAVGAAGASLDSDFGGSIVASTVDDAFLLAGIEGDLKLGGVVTARLAREGVAATYQWYRSTDTEGSWQLIPGATSASYTTKAADFGRSLRVVATATGEGGYQGSDEATTTAPVWKTLDAPTLTVQPTGADSMSITWTKLEGATDYWIALRSTETEEDVWALVDDLADYDSIECSELNANGTYELRILAVGDGVAYDSSEFGESTFVTLGVTKLSPPAITSTSWAGSTVTVNWTPVANASKYYLRYKTDTTGWTVESLGKSMTSYTIEGLTEGATYQIQMNAVGNGTSFISSGYGPTATVTLGTPKLTAPTILETTATNSSITVNWTEVQGATKYTIAYAPVGSSNFTTKSATTPSYTITGLPKGASYQIKVRAVGDGSTYLNSEYSPITTASTLATDPVPLATPSLTVERANVGPKTDSGSLAWEAVDGAVGYTLLYKTKYATSYTTVDLNANATSYSIVDLDGTEIYYFRLRAVGDGVNSKNSSYCGTVTTYPANALEIPKISVTYWTTDSITVRWNAIEGASKYYLAYAPAGSSSFTTKSVVAPNTSYTLSGLSEGESYQFKVRAIADKSTGKLNSSYGSVTTITTGAAKLAPPEIIDSSSTTDSITISWTGLVGAKKYYVDYAPEGSSTFTSKSSTTTSLTLTGLTPNQTYQVKVRATADGENAAVGSNYGETKLISTTSGEPVALTAPTASVTSRIGGEISVAWDAVAGAAGYTLQYRKVETGATITTLNLGANVTSKTVTDLDASASYQFRLRAIGDGETTLTSAYGTWTLSKPTVVTLTAPEIGSITSTSNSITVAWNAISGATKYYVAYATTGGSFVTKSTTATSYTLAGLTPGDTYRFRVRAIGNGETILNSDWSAIEYGEAALADAILELGDELFEELEELENLDLIAEALV